MDAFNQGKNQGLVDALTKVKAVGRIVADHHQQGQLEFELRKNPWKLVNSIDWNGLSPKSSPVAPGDPLTSMSGKFVQNETIRG